MLKLCDRFRRHLLGEHNSRHTVAARHCFQRKTDLLVRTWSRPTCIDKFVSADYSAKLCTIGFRDDEVSTCANPTEAVSPVTGGHRLLEARSGDAPQKHGNGTKGGGIRALHDAFDIVKSLSVCMSGRQRN